MKPSWPHVGCTVGNLCHLEIWPVSCQRVNQFSYTELCRAGFCWENWKNGDASGLQCMHHSHKQVFGLKDWAVAGIRDRSRMGVMPFTPTGLLYGPAPIHLCYLLINTKPHWRMPPFQIPAGPPQPLLSVCSFTSALPIKVFRCWITEMICIKDERKVYILPGVECGSRHNQVHSVLQWSMGVTSPRLGKVLIVLVLVRVWGIITFLAIWQEATAFFQYTFPTPSSLSLFREVSRSFWGEVGQFRKNTKTTDNWHLKLNSCAKVAQ